MKHNKQLYGIWLLKSRTVPLHLLDTVPVLSADISWVSAFLFFLLIRHLTYGILYRWSLLNNIDDKI